MAQPRVAVVGAGLSGLACARALQASGAAAVTVLERAGSVGGRCATMRWRGSVVDHGVQFFTLRSGFARDLLRTGLRFGALDRAGDVRSLGLGAVVRAEDGAPLPISNGHRMYHVRGNNELAARMAEGLLDVRLRCEVTDVHPDGHVEWREGGGGAGDSSANASSLRNDQFDAVICTAPLPQSAALLDCATPPAWASSFAPNITLLLEYEEAALPPASLAHAGGGGRSSRLYAQYPSPQSILAWTACENAKTGRALADGKTIMVAQASDAFSAAHYPAVEQNTTWLADDAADPPWAARMIAELEALWRIPSAARTATYSKRWRYARVAGDAGQPRDVTHVEHAADRVWFCGDGVGRRSRFEHAILNGHHAAHHVAGELGSSKMLAWSPA